MRTKWGRTLFLLAGLAALAGAQLQAQAVTGAKGHAQTDVSLSLFGAFTGSYNNKIMAPEGGNRYYSELLQRRRRTARSAPHLQTLVRL